MRKINWIIKQAKKNPKKIVLPETDDERVVEAAKRIKKEGIADLVPVEYSDADKKDPLYSAAMMVRNGAAHGFVAGANHMTKDVVRVAMKYLGIDHSVGVVSGAFLMEIEDCAYGEDGFFIFADCGVIPTPSPKQLARIAISSGSFLKSLFDIEFKNEDDLTSFNNFIDNYLIVLSGKSNNINLQIRNSNKLKIKIYRLKYKLNNKIISMQKLELELKNELNNLNTYITNLKNIIK